MKHLLTIAITAIITAQGVINAGGAFYVARLESELRKYQDMPIAVLEDSPATKQAKKTADVFGG